MMRRQIRFCFALATLAVSIPLAAATPSRPVPQWQTTPTMWESGTYTYDGAGNIISIGADQYRYDGASRLINATANTPSHANAQTFRYDAYGNLTRIDTQVTPTGGAPVNTATVMAVDANRNQLLEHPTASDCPPGVICVSGAYDAAGNQKSSNGYISYEWDALGNLAKLDSMGRVERYVYDANNERIMTLTVSGSAQRREYTLRNADTKVLRELVDTVSSGTHQWSWTKDYVYRSGTLLAAIAPSNSPGTSGEAISHFHLDHLGTPRVITDARGYRLSLHTYLPYGVEATGSEPDAERMKFTGHERDFGGGPGEDLDYMHARYYAPNAGRFLSIDPQLEVERTMRRPQLWNRYAYVLDNPMAYTDPTGTTVYVVTYTTGNTEGDEAFRRAAMTRAAELQSMKSFDPAKDKVLLRGVATKADFAQAIKDANSAGFGKVGEVSLYSHAGRLDGPIFQSGQASQHQFKPGDLGMTVNWEWWGNAKFFGCNTGFRFTEKFAKAQNQTAYGYEGYATFSSTKRSWSAPRPWGPLYLIHTSGYSNDGVRGMIGKWSGTNDAAIPMDPDP